MDFIAKGLESASLKDDATSTENDHFNLPPYLAAMAERDFGETPDTRAAALIELRTKLEALPAKERPTNLSDTNLIRFLRNRKFNMDRVVETMKAYTKFQNDNADLFHITPEEVMLYDGIWNLMLGDGPDYPVIFTLMPKKIVTLFTEDFVKAHPAFITRFNVWTFERVSHMPQAQVAGIMAAISFKDFSFWDNLALARVVNVQVRAWHLPLGLSLSLYLYLVSST